MTSNVSYQTYDEVIEILRTNADPDIILKISMLLLRKKVMNTISTDFSDFSLSGTDYVVGMIKNILPTARYGFDYNPSNEVKFNKEGKQISAPGQGWVKFSSIDWSITHTNPGQALLIALLSVLRDLEKLNDRTS